jgi:hypothetical protein
MKRSNDFILQNVGGESILVPLGAQVMSLNGLIVLNETGRYVWELLAQERSLDELTTTVVGRFGVAAEIARADVQTFLDEISEMGLLEG